MDKAEILPIKLNGPNYMGWAFQLQHFVKGKGRNGYLDGTTVAPTDGKDEKGQATWDQNNSKVVTWILSSIEPSIALTLHSFSTASAMWGHLKKLYHQTNKARGFLLDTELSKYRQGDQTVHEYFSGFLQLWNEKDTIVLASVPKELITHAKNLHEKTHVNQFLMNLRPEFESVRAALMNRECSPTLETCVQEVLREEIRLQSKKRLVEEPTAFHTSQETSFVSTNRKPVQRIHSTKLQEKNVCNYCKRIGPCYL